MSCGSEQKETLCGNSAATAAHTLLQVVIYKDFKTACLNQRMLLKKTTLLESLKRAGMPQHARLLYDDLVYLVSVA